MKLSQLLASSAVVLALAVPAAFAQSAPTDGAHNVANSTKYVWTEFADQIDNDGGAPVVSFYDGAFSTKIACMKDIRSKIDTSAQPPCPLNGVSDAACGTSGTTYTFYRCLQGLFGTPLQ